jgi:hypothetical protein
MVDRIHASVLDAYAVLRACRDQGGYPPDGWSSERLAELEDELAHHGFHLAGVLLEE